MEITKFCEKNLPIIRQEAGLIQDKFILLASSLLGSKKQYLP